MISVKKIGFFSLAVLIISLLFTLSFFGCSSGDDSKSTTVSPAVTTDKFGDNDADINDFFPGDTVSETTPSTVVDGSEATTLQNGNKSTTKTVNNTASDSNITEKLTNSSSEYTDRPTASSRPEYSTRQQPSTRASVTSPLESALQQADNSEGVSYGDIL